WHSASTTVVKTERDFVKISKRMKRLNRNVSTANGSISERPEVLKAIGVYLAANILNSMVNHLMSVFGFKAIVGQQSIGIKRSSSSDMRLNFVLQGFLPAIGNHDGLHLAMFL